MSAALRKMIEAKGIGYHPGHAIANVDPARRRMSFANGVEADFDLLAYVPPHRAPGVVRNAGMCNERGWIAVDRGTLQTRHAGVYAIGDVTGIMLSSIGKPLPKAGVFAHNQAEVVAHNIATAITGRGATRRFEGQGECFVETGDGKAGFGSGNFYAEPRRGSRSGDRTPCFIGARSRTRNTGCGAGSERLRLRATGIDETHRLQSPGVCAFKLDDPEARAPDEIVHPAVEIASSGDSFPPRIEAFLPAPHACIGRKAVFGEKEHTRGLQHAPDLSQCLDRVRDGAQRPCHDGRVHACRIQGDRLARVPQKLDRKSCGVRLLPRHPQRLL